MKGNDGMMLGSREFVLGRIARERHGAGGQPIRSSDDTNIRGRSVAVFVHWRRVAEDELAAEERRRGEGQGALATVRDHTSEGK